MTVINTNINALVGLNNLRLTGLGLGKSLERLSSGLRINVGADDPSGLAIAMGMEKQIGGVRTAVQNAEDGISLIHTADGTLAETHDILLRMRDLALRGANEAVMTSADQTRLSDEFVSLKKELARKAAAVTFNSKKLFWGSNRNSVMKTVSFWRVSQNAGGTYRRVADSRAVGSNYYYAFGSNSGGLNLQIGADNGANYAVTMVIGTMTLTGLGLTYYHNISHEGSYKGGIFSTIVFVNQTMRIGIGGFGNQLRLFAKSAVMGGTVKGSIAYAHSALSVRQNASYALRWVDLIDTALDKVSNARAALGIQERRLNNVIDDLKAEEINVSAAKSRIFDADMAAEISDFTRLQILQQSGTAILAQANAQPQTILQLMT